MQFIMAKKLKCKFIYNMTVEIKINLFFIFLLQTLFAKRFQAYINFRQCFKIFLLKNETESEIV